MAKLNIFKKAKEEAKKFLNATKKESKRVTRKFVNYFAKNAKKKSVDIFEPGNLLTFNYDAKHKQHKYDKKPLIICLGYSKKYGKKYILGINLHWFPKSRRVTIAKLILMLKEDHKGKLVYEDVKPLIQLFKNTPMLRMYIVKRISKKVIKVEDNLFARAAAIDYADWHIPKK